LYHEEKPNGVDRREKMGHIIHLPFPGGLISIAPANRFEDKKKDELDW